MTDATQTTADATLTTTSLVYNKNQRPHIKRHIYGNDMDTVYGYYQYETAKDMPTLICNNYKFFQDKYNLPAEFFDDKKSVDISIGDIILDGYALKYDYYPTQPKLWKCVKITAKTLFFIPQKFSFVYKRFYVLFTHNTFTEDYHNGNLYYDTAHDYATVNMLFENEFDEEKPQKILKRIFEEKCEFSQKHLILKPDKYTELCRDYFNEIYYDTHYH